VKITHRVDGTLGIIELDGRLTVNDRPGLIREGVASVLRDGARHIALDLAGVHYIDSTRLGELIAAHITVSRQGGRLVLLRTPERVSELLVMAGLGEIFQRFDTVDEARAAIGS
jgi:anti-sigma B factor antagonist